MRALVVIALLVGCTKHYVSLDYEPLMRGAASSALTSHVTQVRESRDSSVITFFLRDYLRRSSADERFVLVEAFALADHQHGFVLISQTATEYVVMSNYRVRRSGAEILVQGTGDIKVYRVPRDATLDGLFNGATRVVSAGIGGFDDVDDGDTFFLWQGVTNGQRAILHGVTFRPFEDPADPATDPKDVERYRAMVDAFALWFRVATSAQPSDVITSP